VADYEIRISAIESTLLKDLKKAKQNNITSDEVLKNFNVSYEAIESRHFKDKSLIYKDLGFELTNEEALLLVKISFLKSHFSI